MSRWGIICWLSSNVPLFIMRVEGQQGQHDQIPWPTRPVLPHTLMLLHKDTCFSKDDNYYHNKHTHIYLSQNLSLRRPMQKKAYTYVWYDANLFWNIIVMICIKRACAAILWLKWDWQFQSDTPANIDLKYITFIKRQSSISTYLIKYRYWKHSEYHFT